MSGNFIRAIAAYSMQGGRSAQEDFALANKDKGIFVVADGFGGGIAGALAAKSACEGVRGFLEREAGDLEATLPFVLRNYYSLAGNVLFNALIHANRKVMVNNKGKNVHEKGGASVLAGFMDGDLLALANVGACSAWLLRGGTATELAAARTYGRLFDPTRIDCPEHLAVPLMAVGMYEDLEPEITEYRIRPGDGLLLHTDGVDSDLRARFVEIQRSSAVDGRGLPAALEEVGQIMNAQTFVDNASISMVFF